MRVNQSPNSPVKSSDSAGAQGAQSAQGAKKTSKADGASAAKGTDKAEAKASTAGAAKTEISGRAKDMAQAKQVASNAPDVREEKIAALKARIAAGKYDVDAEAIADRMVDDHLKTGIG